MVAVALAVGFLIEASEFVSEVEKLQGYWDDKGLDMHIAVKLNGMIAVSTKHWTRTHYIVTDKTIEELWNILIEISKEIGRKYVKSVRGSYVYIPKLNIAQTQDIFDNMKKKLGYEIDRKWEISWDIDDAVVLIERKKKKTLSLTKK